MNYDINRQPTFIEITNKDVAENDFLHKHSSDSHGPGGVFFPITISGTASGVSLSTVSSQVLIFIPEFGPIPGEDARIQHEARTLELKTELRSIK